MKGVYQLLNGKDDIECEFMDLTHGMVGRDEDTIGMTKEGMDLLNQHNIVLKDEWMIPEGGYETTRGNYTWEEDLHGV